jgi:ABC-type dipeptide/oligopeptide/nickel transport system permease subunit
MALRDSSDLDAVLSGGRREATAALLPERPRRRSTIGYMWRLLRSNTIALLSSCVLATILLSAIFAPVLATHEPSRVAVGPALSPPSGNHYFGTDRHGRDMFSRILHGARLSLPVGMSAVVVSLTLGTALGLVTGFFGGKIDAIGSKLIDMWLGFPTIMVALLVIAILGIGIQNAVIAVGISGIPRFARMVRGQTLSVRENVYVEAARAVGASGPGILTRHILPNVQGPIIVLATLGIGGAILSTSALGFLGLGVQPPSPEWGTMLAEAREFMRYAPWLMIFPGAMVFLTVMSVNLLGDFLRASFDPRLRGR